MPAKINANFCLCIFIYKKGLFTQQKMCTYLLFFSDGRDDKEYELM